MLINICICSYDYEERGVVNTENWEGVMIEQRGDQR